MLLRNRIGTHCLIWLIVGVNILIIFMASLQKPNKDDSPNAIPGWLWPTVVFSIFGGGILAWAALVLLQSDKCGKWLGVHVTIHKVTEVDNTPRTWYNGDSARLPVASNAISSAREEAGPDTLRKEAEELMIQKMIKEAKEDGTNRRLQVTVSYTESIPTAQH